MHAFVVKAAANDVDVFHVFDAMNNVCNLCASIGVVKAVGKYA